MRKALRARHCWPRRAVRWMPAAPTLRRSSWWLASAHPNARCFRCDRFAKPWNSCRASNPRHRFQPAYRATTASALVLSRRVCGGVHSCHSGVSERPQPRERSPPNPESASSSSALRTGASHRDAAASSANCTMVHSPPARGIPGTPWNEPRRRRSASGPRRRWTAARRERVRGPGSPGSGTRSRHPPPSDLHR